MTHVGSSSCSQDPIKSATRALRAPVQLDITVTLEEFPLMALSTQELVSAGLLRDNAVAPLTMSLGNMRTIARFLEGGDFAAYLIDRTYLNRLPELEFGDESAALEAFLLQGSFSGVETGVRGRGMIGTHELVEKWILIQDGDAPANGLEQYFDDAQPVFPRTIRPPVLERLVQELSAHRPPQYLLALLALSSVNAWTRRDLANVLDRQFRPPGVAIGAHSLNLVGVWIVRSASRQRLLSRQQFQDSLRQLCRDSNLVLGVGINWRAGHPPEVHTVSTEPLAEVFGVGSAGPDGRLNRTLAALPEEAASDGGG